MRETHKARRFTKKQNGFSSCGVNLRLIQGGEATSGKTLTKTKNPPSWLKQYLEIKEQYQNSILLYRMGDFYEIFFDDAEKASKIIGLTLTSRNRKDTQHIPMCGVPVHGANNAIAQLVRAGQRVAVCSQTNSTDVPKGRVAREVVRVYSPNENIQALKESLCNGGLPDSVKACLTEAYENLDNLFIYAAQLSEKKQDVITKKVVTSLFEFSRLVELELHKPATTK